MIENRHCRVDYLLETTRFTPQTLLEELVRAMSDQEFDTNYQYICRMHGIEPDEEAFMEAQNEHCRNAAAEGPHE